MVKQISDSLDLSCFETPQKGQQMFFTHFFNKLFMEKLLIHINTDTFSINYDSKLREEYLSG